MDNMTAKVSCFARAYHCENNSKWIFKDDCAARLLGDSDYRAISENMTQGIQYFAPGFEGSKEDALRFIVNHQLAPSVLGRSAFCEKHLNNEMSLGLSQYILFASGFDTFAYRNKDKTLKIFELDMPQMIEEKQRREKENDLEIPADRCFIPCDLADEKWCELLLAGGFNPNIKSFGSLLGISYYLEKKSFEKMIGRISDIFAEGSAICFDYPAEYGSEQTAKTEQMASAAGESMKAKYTYEEMEHMLGKYGFLVYEHLDDNEMTKQYFSEYNSEVPTGVMMAPHGVEYILAVKKK